MKRMPSMTYHYKEEKASGTVNKEIDQNHVEQRELNYCVVLLHFVTQKNDQVEDMILDSLLDSLDRRVTA